jgi:hypothetical protein
VTDLDPKAKALVRLAKRGQEPAPDELRAVMSGFERRTRERTLTDVSLKTPGNSRTGNADTRHPRGANRDTERALRTPSGYRAPQLRKHIIKWSLVAAMMTGSLGALANWNVVVNQVSETLSSLVEEVLEVIPSATRGSANSRSNAARSDSSVENASLPTDESAQQPAPILVPLTAAPPDREPHAVALPKHELITLIEPTLALPRRPLPLSTSSPRNVETLPTVPQRVRTAPVMSEREVILIAAARSALAAGSFSQTRRLLNEHQLEFPGSGLAEERETLRALVACRENGDSSLAQRYIVRRPQSLFASRLIRECGLTPLPAASPAVPAAPQ